MYISVEYGDLQKTASVVYNTALLPSYSSRLRDAQNIHFEESGVSLDIFNPRCSISCSWFVLSVSIQLVVMCLRTDSLAPLEQYLTYMGNHLTDRQ